MYRLGLRPRKNLKAETTRDKLPGDLRTRDWPGGGRSSQLLSQLAGGGIFPLFCPCSRSDQNFAKGL